MRTEVSEVSRTVTITMDSSCSSVVRSMQNCRLTCADTPGSYEIAGTTRICRDHSGSLAFRYTAYGYTVPVGTTVSIEERGRLDRPQ